VSQTANSAASRPKQEHSYLAFHFHSIPPLTLAAPMSEELCELGVIGLSAVGQSLAAHHASEGLRVCVGDEDPSFVPEVVRGYRSQIEAGAEDDDEDEDGDEEEGGDPYDRRAARRRAPARCMIPSPSIEDMVSMLKRPRRIVVCGTHGRDGAFEVSIWDLLCPLLEEGDVVLRWGREDDDGGGGCDPAAAAPHHGGGGGGVQFYRHSLLGKLSRTQARPGGIHLLEMVRLAQDRLTLGAAKAQQPFLVGGGSREAWHSLMEPIVTPYGACVAHVGNDVGCVHYAFMIQRAIENGMSQAYAEGADVLRRAAGYEQQDVGRTFKNWNESPEGKGGGLSRSYLTGISSRIYYKRDTLTNAGFIVDSIIDSVASEPVDTWATLEATRLGVPAPTVNAAQETRFLSVMRDERAEASAILKVMDGNDTPSVLRNQIAEDLQHAMYCACLFVVAECLSIFEAASEAESWDADAGECVRMWKRPGSFLESTLMDRVHRALADDGGDSSSLITIPVIASELQGLHMSWRRIVSLSFASAIPCPTISSSLTHYDTYRSGKLPIGLMRAQRDYYDGSGYDRLAEEGWFSTCWVKEQTILKKKELARGGGVQRPRKRKATSKES
jgi:6-phosphogluconate dehydrogenase